MNSIMELSIRDFFAATVGSSDLMAINEPESQKALLGESWNNDWTIEKQISFNMRMEAKLRYAYADAMLKERNR